MTPVTQFYYQWDEKFKWYFVITIRKKYTAKDAFPCYLTYEKKKQDKFFQRAFCKTFLSDLRCFHDSTWEYVCVENRVFKEFSKGEIFIVFSIKKYSSINFVKFRENNIDCVIYLVIFGTDWFNLFFNKNAKKTHFI